jgi:phenylpropionate dioxygenase-like ring-hydroxylating dioxygenase large terminal subunit
MSHSTPVSAAKERALEFGSSRDHFLSPEWHHRDLESVFRPRWQFVGHKDELPNPGSYITFRLGDDEVLVCRASDDHFRAYYNFCRHRGHRLGTQDHGEFLRNIKCQYHGWAYSKDDGSCLSATRMHPEFDKSNWGLRQAWVEEFHGLIFVSFAEEEPTSVAGLTNQIIADDAGIHGYDLDRMKLAASSQFEVDANWKVVKENDDECYHCALNHPELIVGYNPWHGPTVVEDLDAPQHMWTSDEWALLEIGFQQSASQVCAIPSPRVNGGGDFEAQDVQLFWQPSGHLILQSDHAWIWSITPLGPERTLVRQWWLVADDAQEGKDYEVGPLTELFDITMRQDKELCEQVQRGIRMRFYTPGPLNPRYQSPAAAFYRWYERCLRSSA